MDYPKRNLDSYKSIESFEEYEFTQCVAGMTPIL